MEPPFYRALNHAHWERLARFHGRGDDAYYRLDAVAAGHDTLGDHEGVALRRALPPDGDVRGLEVLHLQCHLGLDAVSLARRGARVCALDFSSTALETLRALAARAGVEVETVEADACAPPAHLDHRFDLVWATIGVLCWIEDVGSWMRAVARMLKPGGRLVLLEVHPAASVFSSARPPIADFPYLNDGAQVETFQGSYTDRDADFESTSVGWAHGLGETVEAALGAGLLLRGLDEHLDCAFDPFGGLMGPAEADGRFRLRIGEGREGAPAFPLPILFTLIAERPA